MDKKVTLAQLKEVVQEAYDQVKANTGGKNADYIPYLANVNKDLFGISVCLLNGQTIHVGDTDYRFGIESVSKVHTAILALRQYGAKEILDKIGADATGLPFNSIIAILLENDHPSTPLVNAGAISACSMVQPIGDSAKKWDAIVGNVTDLCGSAPQLIDELYKSESDTNFNNRSIAWLLKNYNRIYDDPDLSLDLYTRQCSLGVTALQLSIAAELDFQLAIHVVHADVLIRQLRTVGTADDVHGVVQFLGNFLPIVAGELHAVFHSSCLVFPVLVFVDNAVDAIFAIHTVGTFGPIFAIFALLDGDIHSPILAVRAGRAYQANRARFAIGTVFAILTWRANNNLCHSTVEGLIHRTTGNELLAAVLLLIRGIRISNLAHTNGFAPCIFIGILFIRRSSGLTIRALQIFTNVGSIYMGIQIIGIL